MSKIYKLYLGRPTEAWYQLSQEEQNNLMAKVVQSLEDAGGKPIIRCSSAWSTETWPFFGVEEFPNIEAAQKQILFKLLKVVTTILHSRTARVYVECK